MIPICPTMPFTPFQKPILSDSDFLEILFLNYLNTSDASTKKVLFSKLITAPELPQRLVEKSWHSIPSMPPQEIINLLKLYEKQGIKDLETLKVLARTLAHKNHYISKNIYDFLIKIQTDDEFVLECLKAYKNP